MHQQPPDEVREVPGVLNIPFVFITKLDEICGV
jgi:hypothetical protein